VVKLLSCDHEVMGSVLETASCENAGKGCVHKTQSGRTLPRALHKRELRAPGCTFSSVKNRQTKKVVLL
jgi:hypothetical protein